MKVKERLRVGATPPVEAFFQLQELKSTVMYLNNSKYIDTCVMAKVIKTKII